MTASSSLSQPLASSIVENPETAHRRALYVLHGIYGRGRNWAATAKHLVHRRPDWRAVLTDLRAHGDSPTLEPPHTVAAAAADLAGLAAHLGITVDAVLGHSFGGKVALQYAASAPAGLRQVWVIDSTPAPKVPDGSAWRLLEVVRRLAGPVTSREDVVAALTADGFEPRVAEWMAANVVWRNAAYEWRVDFGIMESLLRDFFQLDLWSVVENPPPGLMVHLVKAEESSLLTDDACARIEHAARGHGRVQLHRVPGGHWLNTDNPGALLDLLARNLPRQPSAPRR